MEFTLRMAKIFTHDKSIQPTIMKSKKETEAMSKPLETILISLMIALALGPILAVYSLIIYPIV